MPKDQCVHPRYSFQIHVCSFVDTDFRCLQVFAQCIACGEPMQFIGLKQEPMKGEPSMTPDRHEVFIPFQMENEKRTLM